MNKELLIPLEIMLIVNVPLIVLYLKGKWPLRTMILCLISIPLLWYLTYALLHELSHVAGVYLVGGKVVDYKLIPRFWLGEFGTAWIKPDGLTQTWQELVMTSSPYILNIISIVGGILVLRRGFSSNPFVVGLVFMLLCLRPTFDFFSELTGFLLGPRGDFDAVQKTIGSTLTWSFIMFSIGLSLISILVVLRRFVGFPETSPLQPKT